MKKLQRILGLAIIASIAVLGSCSPATSSTTSGGGQSTSTGTSDYDFFVNYKGEEVKNNGSYSISVGEKATSVAATAVGSTGVKFAYSSSAADVLAVSDKGLLSPKAVGTAVITVKVDGTTGSDIVMNFTVEKTSSAAGAQSYASVSYDEKSRLLATLEDYAVDNYLTGITMFSNGGYAVYNERYVPAPREYVVGYGWGTSREGSLKKELPGAIGKHPTYYTIGTTGLAQKANALDAYGSDVSSLYGYISNSYYSTRLNQNGDGYEWYPNLAVDSEKRPIAMNDDGTVASNQTGATHSRWRIHLRSGVKYATSSTKTVNGVNLSSYNGKTVELADYLTPIKLMLTNWNGQYRGAEMTKGVSGFAGAADYFADTGSNKTGNSSALWDDALWNQYMGDNIKTGTDDTGNYIEFNLLLPCTQFYAMYYISSNLYSPLPESFIKTIGVGSFGVNDSTRSLTPVDTMLSSGPYFIDQFDDNTISLKKNSNYYYTKDTFADGNTRDVYQLPGIDMVYISSEQLKNQFENGAIDNYSPDKDALKTVYNTDSGVSSNGVKWNRYLTKGDANFKLNVNATTQEQWNNMFGTTGSVYPHTASQIANNKEWGTRKKYLSDHDFLNFLSFGLDRAAISSAHGSQATQEYFSDNYLIDPESGVSYNSTDAHKAVLLDRYNETYGFNEAAAKEALTNAFENTILPMAENRELTASGTSGTAGTAANPWAVKITMNWMNPSDVTDYSDVFVSLNRIFSEVSTEDYGGCYKLVITEKPGTAEFNQVYDTMKHGEYDLGFGAISGNDLNPLNFFEVLKSDNSSDFTLNWGVDTSKTSPDIVYDGKTWSFDGLWKAGDTGVALANDGSIANISNVSTAHTSADGKTKYDSASTSDLTITYKISFKALIEGGATNLNVKIYGLSNASGGAFTLAQLGATEANNYVGNVTIINALNHYIDEASGKTLLASTASINVNYDLVINNVRTPVTVILKVPTYAGVFGLPE
ncbi:MAG: hypothetical protein WCS80_03275 [Bacilli bacterium]